MPDIHRLLAPTLILVLLNACAQTPSRPAPERQTDTATRSTRETPVEIAEGSAAPPQEASVEATPITGTEGRALTIQLKGQRFVYQEDGRVVRVGPISSGREGYETPKGQFAVLSKDRDKVSSRYTNQLGWNAWMPYSIQFNGHYFLHEGWLPGYPDSHGCVRVGEQDARFLFDRLQVGDAVAVVD
jgi:lipoprotein-anchoring transpeptidase ErfK/SrfK